MNGGMRIVVEAEGLSAMYEVTLPCEFGRQRNIDPAPPAVLENGGESGRSRVVIAANLAAMVSRIQFIALEDDDGGVRLVNTSDRFPVRIRQGENKQTLEPGQSQSFSPPFKASSGKCSVRFGKPAPVETTASLWSLPVPAAAPSMVQSTVHGSLLDRLSNLDAQEVRRVGEWLRDVVGVLHGTLATNNFVEDATRAVVERLPFVSAEALIREPDGRWKTVARCPPDRKGEAQTFSRRVLESLYRTRATTGMGEGGASLAGSLFGVDLALAAPILGPDGAVVGALGAMRPAGAMPRRVDDLDAMLLELLAGCVAVGWAREHQRRQADALESRFEQFFTPQLAAELARDPTALLVGQERDVTLLFADIRGFSRISAGIGPKRTIEWINAVMSALSECVQAEGGVLLNYVGDELFAMWGAPQPQPDHAARAVRAALAMTERMKAERERWKELAGEETLIGIGVNSGRASVGNTGSQTKFQYGALGDAVNIASRLQGLTKQLRCPMLVSRATRDALPSGEFLCRRVLTAKLANIPTPVDVYSVETDRDAASLQFFRQAEAALAALEAGQFDAAVRAAGPMIELRADGPLRLVALRAVEALLNEGKTFEPAWEPPGK